jgi:ABC-type polysaccharide/polyol phosphate transport system ATPase subunit
VNSIAISVNSVSKQFRLYKEKNDSVKATVTKFRHARYDEFTALNNITLDIQVGTTIGIIGSNGSGKSTLLKLLSGIVSPDSGQIAVNGRLVALLELGAGFHPDLTGRENIYLNAAILGMHKHEIEQSIHRIIEFSELGEFIDVAIKNYSSGMVVRLGFSIAVHVNPDVLIIDEVLAVGDESFQKRSLSKILEFKDAGKTIVIVSHDLGAIEQVCDRVLWLNKGIVQEIGPTEIVISNYLDSQREDNKGDSIEHSDKIGTVIKHVAISDGQENDTGIFAAGSSVNFSLVLNNDFDNDAISLVICIRNESGQIVWQNHEDSLVIKRNSVMTDQIVVNCLLPSFPMRQGIFDVLMRVFDTGTFQLIDEWNHDLKFNIVRDEHEDYGFLRVNPTWSY